MSVNNSSTKEKACPTTLVSFLAAISAILSLLMIWACTHRWIREYAGLGKIVVAFGVSSAIVAVYYGIMVVWFWHMAPFANAKN